MKPDRDDEIADRVAEERGENEGMSEPPARARTPVPWTADRRERMIERPPGHTGMVGVAFVSCVAKAAVTYARGAFHWVRHRAAALTH